MNLQVPYHLHAVLVHQGQANAGHYWAFIYDQPRRSWLKYNDISVTESSWEELERDSFGGLKNASAYCLMYISGTVPRLAAGTGARAAGSLAVWLLSLACTVLNSPQLVCGTVVFWQHKKPHLT